jgi:hypothetical protein
MVWGMLGVVVRRMGVGRWFREGWLRCGSNITSEN